MLHDQQINAVCFFDRNIEYQAAVMAASIAAHASKSRPVRLFAFHFGDITVDFADVANRLNSGSFTLTAAQVANPFDRALTEKHSCLTTSLRLAIGDLLPGLSRVIYLDIDILVRAELSALFDADLRGKTLGAVPDALAKHARENHLVIGNSELSLQIPFDVYCERVLALEDKPYFNAGVLVIDLDQWRSNNIKEQCIAFYEKNPLLLFTDQDALNHICKNEVCYIDKEWNYSPWLQNLASLSPQDMKEKIIHFAGPDKPWSVKLDRDPDRFDAEYWAFACSTPFGAVLRNQFYDQFDARSQRLRRCEHKIPPQLRRKIDWVKFVPKAFLKPLAELLCTVGRAFGKYNIHALGVRIFNYHKSLI